LPAIAISRTPSPASRLLQEDRVGRAIEQVTQSVGMPPRTPHPV
jgi:hypothetical protein